MIIADSRESNTISKRLEKKDIEVKSEFLEIGDYLLPNGIAIERKKSDLLNSMNNNRIWKQLDNLSEYEHPILVITTPNKWRMFYFGRGRYLHKSYYGVLAACVYSFDIPVIVLDNDKEFANFLKTLHKKATGQSKSKQKPIERIKTKGVPIDELKIRVFSQLKGVGYKKAEKFIGKYDSIANICEVSEDELQEMKGVGPKTAENIYKILH